MVLWLGALAAITLVPGDPRVGEADPPVGFLCLLCGGRGLADGILNLLFFVPLGMLAGGRGRTARVVLTALLLSATVELAQSFLPGRYPTAGDLVFNGMGALTGSLLWISRDRWLIPGGRGWRGALAGAATAGAVTLLAGLALRPHLTDSEYWGQWTPDLGYLDAYDGRVLSAELAGVQIPSRRIPPDADARGILGGEFVLDVRAIAGSPPGRIAPIFSIYDGDRREILLLGAQGEDLVWRERTWSRVLRLDQPDLRVPGALARVNPGDTIQLGATASGEGRCLSLNGERRCGLGFPAGRGWSLLLYPEGFGPWAARGLDALWLFLLLFPVGYASCRGRVLLVATLSAGGALALAALSTGLLLPSPWGWAAVLAGSATGWLLRNTLVARRPNTER